MSGVLLVTVAGMSPSLIGAYGSSTGVTPNLDEMATFGVLLDQCFLDSAELVEQLTSLATGRHAMQSLRPVNLWQALEEQGREFLFITDDPVAAAWAEQSGCAQVGLIDMPQANAAVERPIDSACVALFEAAATELANNDLDGLVWVHSQGLRAPWDAPLDLRQQFVDPEDPPPPADVGPPSFDVTKDTDPDAVVGWSQVAAAQMSVIDESLGLLLSVMKSRPDAAGWHYAAIGLGGVPLGEHGRVGWGRPQCHAEELQCAAVLCPAPTVPIGWRRGELFQLADIGATIWTMCQLPIVDPDDMWGRSLIQWHATESADRWPAEFQSAIAKVGANYWLRVPAWSAMWDGLAEGYAADDAKEGADQSLRSSHDPLSRGWLLDTLARRRPKLYVKPDDRWEVSEVADRCQPVIEELQQQVIRMLEALERNARSAVPAVEPALYELIR